MKTLRKSTDWMKFFGALSLSGLLAVAPLVGMTATVQAAPVTGYSYDDDYDDENDERNHPRRRVIVTGVVTRNVAGDYFEMRADNGENFRVILRQTATNTVSTLSAGDRVRVNGRRHWDVLVANNLRILQDGDGGSDYEGDVILSGVVTRIFTGQGHPFEFRADNGSIYRVNYHRGNNDPRPAIGDRVEVTGQAANGVITPRSVRLLSGYGGGYGDSSTFLTGIVVRDLPGNEFELRASNGSLYTVRDRTIEPIRLTAGDQVEARGVFSGRVFLADYVRIVSNDDGRRVDFPGTVTFVQSRYRLTIRGDNGRSYTVNSRLQLSTAINSGDRVRVIGTVNNATITADQVLLLNNQGTQLGQRIEFTGTVTRVDNYLVRQLEVRGDNGQIYLVRFRDASNFRRNERVRVIGTLRQGYVEASQVTRF